MPACAAINCTNRQFRGCGKTFHMFPLSQPDLVQKWLHNMRRDKWKPSKKSVLCSDHFQESCFDTTGQTTRLRTGAEPTLFDFPAHPERRTNARKKAGVQHADPGPELDLLAPETHSATKGSDAAQTQREQSYGIGDSLPQMKPAPLPLSALRLLIPPLRLVSAAMWRTIQQKAVADYGMLEEFVSMVTDVVPELLTSCQRAQLCLGLRAKLILELCQLGAPADLEAVQPHLDRMQTLIQTWITEAGGTNTDLPHSNFVDLVKNLLLSPAEKETFFQSVFQEEFGPQYDKELHTLMWLFLSRLETFLPLQSFQLVASMFGEASSVLEDCLQPVSQCAELKVLLQYHNNLGQLNHIDSSLDGACIISALKLPSVEKTCGTWSEENTSDGTCAPNMDEDSLVQSDTQMSRSVCCSAGAGAQLCVGDTRQKEEEELTPIRQDNASNLLKPCLVQLERLGLPPSSSFRPERPNRGLKMKQYLLEERRRLDRDPSEENHSFHSRPENVTEKETWSGPCEDFNEAVGSPRSDDGSWSYYSDEDLGNEDFPSSASVADSWSYYSSDASSLISSPSRSPDRVSLPACSDENSFPADLESLSPESDEPDLPDTGGAAAPKKAPESQCFVCKERVAGSLRSHLKAHFPSGDYACPQCDSRFRFASSLTGHVRKTCFERLGRQVDPERPEEAKSLYKCDKCQEAFRYKVSLRKHALTHHELYCHVCRKILRDAETLARHKASHTLYQCTRCDESFARFKPLFKHCENVHRMGKPFQCGTCPKALRSLRLLIIHEWCHTGQLPFKCAVCSLRFKCAAELAYHERVHTREKPYLCTECGRMFAQKSNLLRHLTLVHSEAGRAKKHACSQCPKSFKEKGALKKHQRTKHLNELFRSPCQYCGKMIATSTMARHRLIHTGEKPFKCPECSQHFRSAVEVKRHGLVRHSTERPYKCDVCGKGFVSRWSLKSHARVHTGEKPHVCPICLKAFPKAYSMLRHKRLIHSFVTQ